MKLTVSKLSSLAPLRPQKGFTLIELLVVFGAIIVVGSIGLFYYRDYGRKQTVTQAAETLRTLLVQINQKAFAGERPSSCTATTPLTSYQFSWASNNFSVLPICGWTGPYPTPINLPPNVSMTGSCPATINFYTLGQGTSLSSDCSLTLTGYGSFNASLSIRTSGNIQ